MEKSWRSQSRAWKLSPAALALAGGLAGWGAAALAGEPIDGVDDKLGKNPGGSVASTPTNNNRTIQFTGLERTAPNPNGGDTTPQNKYADDFTQPNRALLEKPDDPLQPGISDQGSSGGLSSYDRASPPDAASGGDRAARTFEVRVQPVNDPPSKVATGIPPPVDPGGAPVKVQLRNVDTGALARTMPNPAKGELEFTGLQVGNYVVEIVDAAGKIIGTSPSLSVAAGGRLSGRLGQSERNGGLGAFFASTAGAPMRQNASTDKSAGSTVAASNAAESPVGGFGQGSPGSPGFGPNVVGMSGPASGMMSPPGSGPAAPAMNGPMGGPPGPMMGGRAMGRP